MSLRVSNIQRIDTTSSGAQVGDNTDGLYAGSFNADSSKVLFYSTSEKLVPNDTNGHEDVFVKDLSSGNISLIGVPGDTSTQNPHLSSDGTKVVFYSYSPEYTPSGVYHRSDVYVKNLSTGAMTQVSTSANGARGNDSSLIWGAGAFSHDGTKVMFSSLADNLVPGDTNHASDLFVKTLATGAITLVNAASNAGSVGGEDMNTLLNFSSSFSPDDTRVLFTSNATNLVSGDTNAASDVFTRNLSSGAITRLSVAANGAQANAGSYSFDNYQGSANFSADGTKVLFGSAATNLVAGDAHGVSHAFVKTVATNAIVAVDASASGALGDRNVHDARFLPDGNHVFFSSAATDPLSGGPSDSDNFFVKNLSTGALVAINSNAAGVTDNSIASAPVFSADGTKAVFLTGSRLTASDTNDSYDLYVKNIDSGAVTLVSAKADGSPANGNQSLAQVAFSPDGTKVVFASTADNLAPGNTNGASNVFVKNLVTGEVTAITTDNQGHLGNASSSILIGFSPDGTKILFSSDASNLVANDTNGTNDYFVATLSSDGPGTLTGTDNAEKLTAPNTATLIQGLGGNDTLLGGTAADTLIGGLGKDVLTGGAGADVFKFAALNESNSSTALYDRIIDFTEGSDKVDVVGLGFTSLIAGTTKTASASVLREYYDAANDRTYVTNDQTHFLFYLDHNHLSTLHADSFTFNAGPATLTGTDNAEKLTATNTATLIQGLGGNDTLMGGTAADTLVGGLGKDVLTGGAGADVFKFAALNESNSSTALYDRITDFTEGTDKVDVSGLGFTSLIASTTKTASASVLREYYDAVNDRTYVTNDQTHFLFYLDHNHLSTLHADSFILA